MSSVVFVDDVNRSRMFYTDVLGQKVTQDYGKYIGFEGGFGIWEKAYAMSVIYRDRTQQDHADSTGMELYFETETLDEVIARLRSCGVPFIHGLYTHDWGQRSIRIQDPDGFIVEIGEPISSVVRRFFQEGLRADQIAEKTGLPLSEVESCR